MWTSFVCMGETKCTDICMGQISLVTAQSPNGAPPSNLRVVPEKFSQYYQHGCQNPVEGNPLRWVSDPDGEGCLCIEEAVMLVRREPLYIDTVNDLKNYLGYGMVE